METAILFAPASPWNLMKHKMHLILFKKNPLRKCSGFFYIKIYFNQIIDFRQLSHPAHLILQL